jgi:hypothetical protein
MRKGPHNVGPFSICLTSYRDMARERRRMKHAIRQMLHHTRWVDHYPAQVRDSPSKKRCRHSVAIRPKTKKATIASGLRNSLNLMVPEAGIEPARLEKRGILNPLCLPISPLGHRNRYQSRVAGISIWRHVPESNRTKRICNPLHNRFANAPCKRELALDCLNLERETRLELATPTLARSCSTN